MRANPMDTSHISARSTRKKENLEMKEAKARMLVKMKEGVEGVAAVVASSLQKATKGRNDNLINTIITTTIIIATNSPLAHHYITRFLL